MSLSRRVCAILVRDDYKVYRVNGERHRESGPAIEYDDGRGFWYLHDRQHRKDGPAIHHPDGRKFWYLNGKEYTEEEYNKAIKLPA